MSNIDNKEQEVIVENSEIEVVEENEVNTENTQQVETDAKVNDNKKEKVKNDKKKKDKQPKEHKVAKKVKETTSELKKVSWLSFGQVCKRTGIVLGFVVLFTVVLFGIDYLLSLLYNLLISSIPTA